MKTKTLAVLSGGMDSTVMTYQLWNCPVLYKLTHAVNFSYGSKHNEREREKARITCQKLGLELIEIDLDFIHKHFKSDLLKSGGEVPEGHYADENMKKTVVPFRNGIMLSIATGLAESLGMDAVALGSHTGDHAIYPDCRPEFRDALEHAFKIGNWDSEKVSYYTPYLHGNKTTILQDSLQSCERLSLDFDTVLANTNTSYNPDSQGRSSGKSGSDIERIEAFLNIGRKDPIEYQSPWEDVVAHAKTVLNK